MTLIRRILRRSQLHCKGIPLYGVETAFARWVETCFQSITFESSWIFCSEFGSPEPFSSPSSGGVYSVDLLYHSTSDMKQCVIRSRDMSCHRCVLLGLHIRSVPLESSLDTLVCLADMLYSVAIPALNKTVGTCGRKREGFPNVEDPFGSCTFEG